MRKLEILSSKNIQIGCLTLILFILAFLSFQQMTEKGESITHETIPIFIFYGFLTVTLFCLAGGVSKWFCWLKKREKLVVKDLFFSPLFFIWFIINTQIILSLSVYYTYYNFPDFKYGFIFDIANVLVIIFILYFLVRLVHKESKQIKFTRLKEWWKTKKSGGDK